MRKLIFLVLGLGLSLCMSAQKVIDTPYVSASTAGSYVINKVILNPDNTILECAYSGHPQSWFSIPGGTYLTSDVNDEKLYIRSIVSDSLRVGQRIYPPAQGAMRLVLEFPPLPEGSQRFDYIEGNKGGNWKLLGVSLTDTKMIGGLPYAFRGDWLGCVSHKWVLSVDADVLIYYGKPYKEVQVKEEKGVYFITLPDKKLIARVEDGQLYIGKDQGDMLACEPNTLNAQFAGVAYYPMPEFEMKMDTAYYSGFLTNYSPFFGHTGTVFVDNVLTHNQDQFLIEIDSSGWFEVKVPMYYPHDVYFRLPSASYDAYLVPGEKLTQLINGRVTRSLGKYARYNDERRNLSQLCNSYDYNVVRNKIANMTLEDYKEYCVAAYHKDLNKWRAFCDQWNYNDAMRALGERDAQYIYMSNLWSYDMKKSAYAYQQKKKGNIYSYDKPDSSYYNDLLKLPIDQLEIISTRRFSSFINRLEYADFLVKRKSYSISTDQLCVLLQANGVELSDEEKKVLEAKRAHEESAVMKTYLERSKVYADARIALYSKYKMAIRTFQANNKDRAVKDGFYTTLKPFLQQDTSIHLTEDELECLTQLAACETEAYNAANYAYHNGVLKDYAQFNQKYMPYISTSHTVQRADDRAMNFLAFAGDKGRFLNDVMISRMLCPNSDKLETLLPTTAKYIEENVESQFIKDYIYFSDKEVKKKIALNKQKTGYNVRKVPETKGEKLFAEMIKPFAGKVVYVDFWATWCGPCRSGMRTIKPLKEEMKGRDDIVFLYVTSVSSPEQTYKSMIPDIKGEHYRLSADEWNYITNQFGVTGIPHYLLVDKNGNVVNNNNKIRAGQSDLKNTLLKYMNE